MKYFSRHGTTRVRFPAGARIVFFTTTSIKPPPHGTELQDRKTDHSL